MVPLSLRLFALMQDAVLISLFHLRLAPVRLEALFGALADGGSAADAIFAWAEAGFYALYGVGL